MQHTRTISTVEVHTGGEPFRIVTSGLPRLPGNSIVERRAWAMTIEDRNRPISSSFGNKLVRIA